MPHISCFGFSIYFSCWITPMMLMWRNSIWKRITAPKIRILRNYNANSKESIYRWFWWNFWRNFFTKTVRSGGCAINWTIWMPVWGVTHINGFMYLTVQMSHLLLRLETIISQTSGINVFIFSFINCVWNEKSIVSFYISLLISYITTRAIFITSFSKYFNLFSLTLKTQVSFFIEVIMKLIS